MYSCSAQLVSFEIDCFYGLRTRIYEYVPPNYRASYGPAVVFNIVRIQLLNKYI